MKKLFHRRKIISDKNYIQRNQITHPTPNFESFHSTIHNLDELKNTNIKNNQQKDLEISNLKIEVDKKNNEIFDLRKRMEESENKFLEMKNKYEEKNKKYGILEKLYNEYKGEKDKGKKMILLKLRS